MKFGDAVEALKAGKPVRRLQWPEDVSLRHVPGPGGKPRLLRGRELTQITPTEAFAEDWILVEEK